MYIFFNNKKKIKIFALVLIFIFSFGIRLININKAGKTIDENAYVEVGYHTVELLVNGKYFPELDRKIKFEDMFWFELPERPLPRYVYGVLANWDIKEYHPNGKSIFNYDYTYARLGSAFISSLAVVLVVLIGFEFVSLTVGVIAGLILAMLPFYLGLSQLASIESFTMFFFTATIYAFFHFLNKPSKKNILITSLLLSMSLMTKYTNFLLVPLMFWMYFIWNSYNNKENKKQNYIVLIFLIFILSVAMIFVFWPLPWVKLKEIIDYEIAIRINLTKHSVPEVFFGRLMFVPVVYYVVQFLITTPIVVLILFIIGLSSMSGIIKRAAVEKKSRLFLNNYRADQLYVIAKRFFLINTKAQANSVTKNKWILFCFIAWFCFPFVQSIYNFRQHGVRYIIEIYAPLALISAVGFEYIIRKYINNLYFKILLAISLFIYMLLTLWKISPYYIDYFNGLVGGAKGVYEKKIFQLGWWGEGNKEAIYFLVNHAKPNSSVATAKIPTMSIPPAKNLNISEYEYGEKYDYVVVPHYSVIREGFNDFEVRKNYDLIYCVNADGACIVKVYKNPK